MQKVNIEVAPSDQCHANLFKLDKERWNIWNYVVARRRNLPGITRNEPGPRATCSDSTQPHGGDNATLLFPSAMSGEEEAGRRWTAVHGTSNNTSASVLSTSTGDTEDSRPLAFRRSGGPGSKSHQNSNFPLQHEP